MGSHTSVPPALAAQPRDRRRGLPVPYAQHRQPTDVEGEVDADFAVLDPTRMLEVARRQLCAVCGERLTYWIAFLGGPGSATSRAYVDGPMHEACAEAAMQMCPHMAHPRTHRASEDRLSVDTTVPDGWVETKPEEFVMYLTRSFTYELRTASGGLAGVFVPAAPHHLRRFSWGPDGVLTELSEEGGDV